MEIKSKIKAGGTFSKGNIMSQHNFFMVRKIQSFNAIVRENKGRDKYLKY